MLERLFTARSHFRPIVIPRGNVRAGSRIGGVMPSCFSGLPPCPRCGRQSCYFVTIEGDLVGDEVAQGRAVSVFSCCDAGCLLSSSALDASPPSVFAITHAPSPRGRGPGGGILTWGRMRPDKKCPQGGSTIETCKIGGAPFHVQSSVGIDEQHAAAQGLSFLLQLDEQQLGKHTTKMGFWGGVVYLFAQTDPATGLPTLEGVRASWAST